MRRRSFVNKYGRVLLRKVESGRTKDETSLRFHLRPSCDHPKWHNTWSPRRMGSSWCNSFQLVGRGFSPEEKRHQATATGSHSKLTIFHRQAGKQKVDICWQCLPTIMQRAITTGCGKKGQKEHFIIYLFFGCDRTPKIRRLAGKTSNACFQCVGQPR